MALDNLISIEFTQAEITDIMAHMAGINGILASKVVNLTPDQRTQYGRLGDGTENFVVKTKGYADQKPEMIPFFVDQNELKKDFLAREAITPMLKLAKIIFEALDDTHKLLGWDVYNNILAIYRNTKMLSRQNVPGINVIYEDLKKQFPHHVKQPDVSSGGTNPPATNP